MHNTSKSGFRVRTMQYVFFGCASEQPSSLPALSKPNRIGRPHDGGMAVILVHQHTLDLRDVGVASEGQCMCP